MALMAKLAEKIFNFCFGLFSLVVFFFLALFTGAFFKGPTEKGKLELAIERDKFWNLSKSWSGFQHYFLKLRDGLKIHYVANETPDSDSSKNKDLFIFIHGFPDSWALWRYILTSSLRTTATLVAFDLPGYGGSDSLERYGPTEIFEVLAEFIVEIRELYGFDTTDGDDGMRKVFIVGHDWGCALGSRLAAEAPDLADRFILSNAPVPYLLADNAERISSSAAKMFKMFLHHPITHRPLLRKSLSTMSPFLAQLKRFSYAFSFQLPDPLLRIVGTFANQWLIRLIHRIAFGKIGSFTPHDEAEMMASTLGPSLLECETFTSTTPKSTYPDSVHPRASSPAESFIQQTSLYRHNATFGRWTKSLETIAALHTLGAGDVRRRSGSGAGLFPNGRQTLNQKATFIWGQQDPALVDKLALHGIQEYLTKGSQVVLLPRTGHFTPIEWESRAAFQKALEWAAAGEKAADLEKVVGEVYRGATVMVNK